MKTGMKRVLYSLIQTISLNKILWYNNKNAIYLTFDDGPTEQTLEILELLKKNNIKATFFVLGKQVVKYPDIVKKIGKAGHTIANHTFSHVKYDGNIKFFINEIKKTEQVINDLDITMSKFIRIPYGFFDFKLIFVLLVYGYKIVFWNQDPKEFKLVTLNDAYQHINLDKIQMGDIILLHDDSKFVVPIINIILKNNIGKFFTSL